MIWIKSVIQAVKRKFKKRKKCSVDFKKRYKMKSIFGKLTAVDCSVCGMTYWAENLTSLKEAVEIHSECKGERHEEDN